MMKDKQNTKQEAATDQQSRLDAMVMLFRMTDQLFLFMFVVCALLAICVAALTPQIIGERSESDLICLVRLEV